MKKLLTIMFALTICISICSCETEEERARRELQKTQENIRELEKQYDAVVRYHEKTKKDFQDYYDLIDQLQ